jgi:hypothetical protein
MDEDWPSDKVPNPQKQSIFFTLPPELRQEIYRLIFNVSPTPDGTVRQQRHSKPHPNKPTVLSILQTCALIRNEAEDLFYNKHHIKIVQDYGADETKAFIQCSNSCRLAAIRKITVVVRYFEHVPKIFKLSRDVNTASSLSIIVAEAGDMTADHSLQSLDGDLASMKNAAEYLPINLKEFYLEVCCVRGSPSEQAKVRVNKV